MPLVTAMSVFGGSGIASASGLNDGVINRSSVLVNGSSINSNNNNFDSGFLGDSFLGDGFLGATGVLGDNFIGNGLGYGLSDGIIGDDLGYGLGYGGLGAGYGVGSGYGLGGGLIDSSFAGNNVIVNSNLGGLNTFGGTITSLDPLGNAVWVRQAGGRVVRVFVDNTTRYGFAGGYGGLAAGSNFNFGCQPYNGGLRAVSIDQSVNNAGIDF